MKISTEKAKLLYILYIYLQKPSGNTLQQLETFK